MNNVFLMWPTRISRIYLNYLIYRNAGKSNSDLSADLAEWSNTDLTCNPGRF